MIFYRVNCTAKRNSVKKSRFFQIKIYVDMKFVGWILAEIKTRKLSSLFSCLVESHILICRILVVVHSCSPYRHPVSLHRYLSLLSHPMMHGRKRNVTNFLRSRIHCFGEFLRKITATGATSRARVTHSYSSSSPPPSPPRQDPLDPAPMSKRPLRQATL